jgi:hypothetical protein
MGGARIGEAPGDVTPLCTAGLGEALKALFRTSIDHFLILLAVALALRAYTFGDPNLFIDEAFYFAAGNAMHHGVLPYVDVWDRKPFGLFALYWLIAGISSSPAAYQIAATLFAALTAWTIGRIVRPWCDWPGALGAGIAYLFLLAPFQGFGGQTPVFYNLFIALGALLVARSAPQLGQGLVPRAVPLAMFSAGLAITIKTTALFEAAFLGLVALAALWHAPLALSARLRHAAGWALIGALPTLAIMAGYALAGHWSEYWQAMTGANLSGERWDAYSAQIRFRLMLNALAPLLALAAFGVLELQGQARRFVLLWIGAALLGLVAFPYFHKHYALPLLVPLCVAAGAFLARKWIGPLALIALCAWMFSRSPAIDFAHTARSTAAMERLATAIRDHGGERGLLVYEGPPFLYTMAGQPFPSPLAFPAHLYHAIERDVSHLGTLAEVRRVIATRPGVVVLTEEPRDGPLNDETYAVVDAYVRANCSLVAQQEAPERLRADQVLVWGDCGQSKGAPDRSGAP